MTALALAPASALGPLPCGGAAATWPQADEPDTELLVLRDGRPVTLRPVAAHDAAAEQRFVRTLSPRSRLLRFHGAVNLLPAAVLREMTQVDQCRHVALVAEALADDGVPRLVADARYVVTDDDAAAAEFAIAVADDWQRQGLGRALLQRLARRARANGLRRLHGSVLAGNEAMLALVRQLGATLQVDRADASVLTAQLPA